MEDRATVIGRIAREEGIRNIDRAAVIRRPTQIRCGDRATLRAGRVAQESTRNNV